MHTTSSAKLVFIDSNHLQTTKERVQSTGETLCKHVYFTQSIGAICVNVHIHKLFYCAYNIKMMREARFLRFLRILASSCANAEVRKVDFLSKISPGDHSQFRTFHWRDQQESMQETAFLFKKRAKKNSWRIFHIMCIEYDNDFTLHIEREFFFKTQSYKHPVCQTTVPLYKLALEEPGITDAKQYTQCDAHTLDTDLFGAKELLMQLAQYKPNQPRDGVIARIEHFLWDSCASPFSSCDE